MLKSIEANFDHPEVNKLLTKHFIELRSVSPEGSTHVLDIHGLKNPTIKFWSLWQNDNLLGCGALKFLDKEHGEFKSIRIHDKFRNKGAGKFFEPARKLFEKCNFKPCKPFAHYKEDINSIYLTKLINNE